MQPANKLVVYATLLVALLCQLFPWVGQGIILRPDFMLVVLIYWLLRAPHLCNLGMAWLAGLLVDLATSSLMGQYALAFTLTGYIALSYQRRLVLFNQFQLAAYVLALLFFERLTILLLKLFSGNDYPGWTYFLPIVTSMMLWQLMIWTFGFITRPKSS